MSKIDTLPQDLTPYQKRLKEVQEEKARIWHEENVYHTNNADEQERLVRMMLPLAIRQIEREAEAVKEAIKVAYHAGRVGALADIKDYLKQQGYTE